MRSIKSTLRHRSLQLLLLFVLVSSLKDCCLAGEPARWAQWRGQDGKGISQEKDLPGEWKPDTNILWKVSIAGRGHSSPIVWGNRIFVTTAVEGEQLPRPTAVKHIIDKEEFKHPDWVGSDHRYTMKVLCLDGDNGKILWEANAYEGTVFDHRHRRSSYASPTPVTDGENVYVYFGSEGVYAYSFMGNLIWKSSLGGIPTIGMGVGTSPVLFENLLIVQADER
jgi:outer membrane protein assembly factor BamB